jgi:hypothetical protein
MKQAIWRSCTAMFAAELFVTVLLLLSVHCVSGFSCVCSPSECEELSESDCPGGGTVWDPCGCCRVCARVENEPCGGPYGFYGSCAAELECVVAAHATGKPVLAANSEGICKRKQIVHSNYCTSCGLLPALSGRPLLNLSGGNEQI